MKKPVPRAAQQRAQRTLTTILRETLTDAELQRAASHPVEHLLSGERAVNWWADAGQL